MSLAAPHTPEYRATCCLSQRPNCVNFGSILYKDWRSGLVEMGSDAYHVAESAHFHPDGPPAHLHAGIDPTEAAKQGTLL